MRTAEHRGMRTREKACVAASCFLLTSSLLTKKFSFLLSKSCTALPSPAMRHTCSTSPSALPLQQGRPDRNTSCSAINLNTTSNPCCHTISCHTTHRFYIAKHAAAAAGVPEQKRPSSDRAAAPSTSASSESPLLPPVRMPWLLTANTRLEALFDADIGECGGKGSMVINFLQSRSQLRCMQVSFVLSVTLRSKLRGSFREMLVCCLGKCWVFNCASLLWLLSVSSQK